MTRRWRHALVALAIVASIGLVLQAQSRSRIRFTTPGTNTSNPWLADGCGVGGCIVQTSFTSAQGWTQDASQVPTGGGSCTGFSDNFGNHGPTFHTWLNSFLSPQGPGCTQVVTAANHSSGNGGRGYRQPFSDGTNGQGGSMGINLGITTQQLWISYVQRITPGSAQGIGISSYIKTLYQQGTTPYIAIGFEGNSSPGADIGGTVSFTSSKAFSNFNDGAWHCFEYAFDITGQRAQMWADGTKVFDATGLNYNGLPNFGGADFGLIVNQNNVTGCTASGQPNGFCWDDLDDFSFTKNLTWGQHPGCPGNGT